MKKLIVGVFTILSMCLSAHASDESFDRTACLEAIHVCPGDKVVVSNYGYGEDSHGTPNGGGFFATYVAKGSSLNILINRNGKEIEYPNNRNWVFKYSNESVTATEVGARRPKTFKVDDNVELYQGPMKYKGTATNWEGKKLYLMTLTEPFPGAATDLVSFIRSIPPTDD